MKKIKKYGFSFEPCNYENGALLYFYGKLFKSAVNQTGKIKYECVS